MNIKLPVKAKVMHYIGIMYILCNAFYSCNHTDTVHAIRKNIYEAVYAPGKIIATDEHYIFALSNGTVVRKLVNEEDTVRQGQHLFQIENTSTTSGLNITSDKVKLVQQFASPSAARVKYFITSDCNCIVYKTMKQQGEAVHLNEAIILIGEPNKRIIQLSVDPQDIDKIKYGQQVLLKTDITGDTIYKAIVTKIYSLMDEVNQSFRVDAAFTENFPHQFIHNSVEANIVIKEKRNALVIPHFALAGNDSLLVELNGKPGKIKVETGISSMDYIEILNGINDKTQIIVPKSN